MVGFRIPGDSIRFKKPIHHCECGGFNTEHRETTATVELTLRASYLIQIWVLLFPLTRADGVEQELDREKEVYSEKDVRSPERNGLGIVGRMPQRNPRPTSARNPEQK